jgi:hypothetical protein
MSAEDTSAIPIKEIERRRELLAALHEHIEPEEVFRLPHVMVSATPISSQRAFGMMVFTNKAVIFLRNAAFRLPRTLGIGMVFDAIDNVADQEIDAEFKSMEMADKVQDIPVATLIEAAEEVIFFSRSDILRVTWPWWLNRALRLHTADKKKMDFYLNRVKKDISANWISQVKSYFGNPTYE